MKEGIFISSKTGVLNLIHSNKHFCDDDAADFACAFRLYHQHLHNYK
jgi:hypothetical protein